MDIIAINQQLERIFNETSEALTTHATNKSEFDRLDKLRESTLAVLASSFSGSEAQRKREALKSSKYKELLEKLAIARLSANTAFATVKKLEVQLSCLQTLSKNLTK